jgi:hypothetical protein
MRLNGSVPGRPQSERGIHLTPIHIQIEPENLFVPPWWTTGAFPGLVHRNLRAVECPITETNSTSHPYCWYNLFADDSALDPLQPDRSLY